MEEAFGESGWDGFCLVGSAAEGEREEGIRGQPTAPTGPHAHHQSVSPSLFPQTDRQSVSHHLGPGVAARHLWAGCGTDLRNAVTVLAAAVSHTTLVRGAV